MKFLLPVIGVLVLIFVLVAFPLSIEIIGGKLSVEFEVMIDLTKEYLGGIFTGDSFHYQEGIDRNPNFFSAIPDYFITSFMYLAVAIILAIMIGLLISAWFSRSRREWMKDLIGFLGMVPDFIMVLFLQLGTVYFYQATGHRLARIATRGVDEHAILLPLLTLTIVPAIYLIRSLSERTYDVLTDDYILTAKAKGLQRIYIFVQHVIRNVLPFLKADLHKVIAILMSNLFIVEYLFNISGLAGFLFNTSEYQFNLTTNILITLVVLYLVLYWFIRLFIACLERIFAHD
ncbi:ABC transporter permease subunit [Virgibacillus oceani]|uniref:Peptide ABC transporter permease n=1 Tax=Virgibacillus oceani TaxID=1479511 RepID=A0A917M4Q4_9BACI|nr:ABC transporter permease subunit [Virgibacillus oceani]GGG77732.1 peptide ABC transporter permease [Virgibacillus oceani]